MAGINLDELADIQLIDSDGDELQVNADGSINTDLIAGAEVQITDGTDTLAVNADGSLNAQFSPSATTTMKTTAETVGVTAVQVVSTALANRRTVTIQNEGNQDVYFGEDNTVTTSTGMKISKKSSATYDLGPLVDIYMISGTAGQDVRILELA